MRGLLFVFFGLVTSSSFAEEWVVETVSGPIPMSELGLALEHEHVLVDFVGAEHVSRSRYDPNEVFEVVLPHLERAAELGVKALFECTPAFLARDPVLLRRLSEASGLHIVTNTGLYGAANDKFVPAYAYAESAGDLAKRWIAEARYGIEGTGIKPGFIKTAVDPVEELSRIDRKFIEAAAITHRETGLAIAVHTGGGPGLAIIDILKDYGVSPAAFIWAHAQGADYEAILQAVRSGAWVSLDGVRSNSLDRHASALVLLKKAGFLRRVLISHDAGWFDPAKPGGGLFRGYDTIFTKLLPTLRERGFSEQDLEQVLVRNPAQAFAKRARLLESGSESAH